jgi:hypothetical protein
MVDAVGLKGGGEESATGTADEEVVAETAAETLSEASEASEARSWARGATRGLRFGRGLEEVFRGRGFGSAPP